MPDYNRDLIGWAQEQAALLRAGRLAEIDAEHIADEIAGIANAMQVGLQDDARTESVFLGYDLSRGSTELPHFEIRALAMIGAGLLMRHRGDAKAIRKLGRLAQKFDGYRENETVKALAHLLDEAADPAGIDDDTAIRELTALLKSRGII